MGNQPFPIVNVSSLSDAAIRKLAGNAAAANVVAHVVFCERKQINVVVASKWPLDWTN